MRGGSREAPGRARSSNDAARRGVGRPLLLALAVGAAVAVGCASDDRRPNVLLIVVDTLRADHLGTYGHSEALTPHIDALAAGGIVFERAIAASARTAPSHASIMTGLTVREHSIGFLNGSTRLDDETTLAMLFHAAGYRTAAFVSNYMLTRRMRLDTGFEVYDDALTRTETNRSHILERLAPETARRAIEWLSPPREEPYFLWVHFQDPHGPYEPPPAYLERVPVEQDPDEEPLPVLEVQRGWKGIPAYQELPSERRPSRYRRRYAAEVALVDAWVGRLLAAAERASGNRDTVVLLTADHGESLGDQDFYFVHGHLTFPSTAHVPLILRAPGIPPGRRSELVHHVDVLPTLLELARLPVPPQTRGIPLGRHVRTGEPIPERMLFTDIGDEVGAYQGDRYLRVKRGGEDIRWRSYAWGDDGTLEPTPEDRRHRSSVLRYVRTSPPMKAAPEPDEEHEDRLRALGYAQ